MPRGEGRTLGIDVWGAGGISCGAPSYLIILSEHLLMGAQWIFHF